MGIQISKKRLIPIFLVLMMLLGMMPMKENALAGNKNVDVNITNLTITNTEGNVPPNGYYANMLFKLNVNWDASKYGNTLREGDYFELQLPNQFKYPESAADCNFNLFTKDGYVIAKALVLPNTPGGGKV